MTMSPLSRSSQSLRAGLRTCVASTSKQKFATSSRCLAEETSPTSQTPSMQDTQAQITPPVYVGESSESRRRFDGQGGRRLEGQGGRQGGTGRRPPRSAPLPPPYKDWVSGEGKQYEEPPPGRGPFWIGSTPFPLNPSFDPPPPISQKQKETIWKMHVSEPENTVRVLSGKFGIPMERIHAILRLQALESEWTKKGKVLQQPFNKNMERLLGAIEKPVGAAMEPETASVSKSTNLRGPIYEESGMGTGEETFKSAIIPALEVEARDRATKKRTLPTGGPASRGPSPSTKTLPGTGPLRAPIKFVDMSSRPTSYIGAGMIARNEKRAAKRKQYKAKKAEARREAEK